MSTSAGLKPGNASAYQTSVPALVEELRKLDFLVFEKVLAGKVPEALGDLFYAESGRRSGQAFLNGQPVSRIKSRLLEICDEEAQRRASITPDSLLLAPRSPVGTATSTSAAQAAAKNQVALATAVQQFNVPAGQFAVSPDGKTLVVTQRDGERPTLQRYDAGSGKLIGEPEKLSNSPGLRALAVGNDGSVFAAFSKMVLRYRPGLFLGTSAQLGTRDAVFVSLGVSADGSEFAAGTSDGVVALSGSRLLRGHRGPVNAVVFSRDGKQIVSGSADKELRRWDAKTGQELGQPLAGHEQPVRSIAFSPDDSQLVSCDGFTILRWDASTGEPVGRRLTWPRTPIRSVRFSPDGSQVVATSEGGSETIRRWDLASGEFVDTMIPRSPEPVTVGPDGAQAFAVTYFDSLVAYKIAESTAAVAAARGIQYPDGSFAPVLQGTPVPLRLTAGIIGPIWQATAIAAPDLNPAEALAANTNTARAINGEIPTDAPAEIVALPATRAARRGVVGFLDLFAKADPSRGQGLLDVLSQRDLFDGFTRNRPDLDLRDTGRLVWLPLAMAEKTKALLPRAVNEDLRRRSETLKAALDGFSALGGKAYFPEVVIGTGPAGASYAFTKRRKDPRAGILMVDAANVVAGGNTAGIGEMVTMNSALRPQTGAKPRPGSDETINPIAGPISPADLSGRRWGTLDSFATCSAVAIAAADVDVLLSERLTNILDRELLADIGVEAKAWPGRYQLQLASGRTIYTDRWLMAQGLGDTPKLTYFDPDCRAFIKTELDKIDFSKPTEVPRIIYAPDALQLGRLSVNGRQPYRDKVRTAVIGAGDGGKVVLEWLHGLGPESAYGNGRVDSAQQGVVGENLWFVTEDGPRDCDQFKDAQRPRYAQLQALLKSNEGQPRIKLAAAKVTRVDPITEGPDAGALKITCVGYPVNDARTEAASTYTVVVDRLILGTGYEDDTANVLRGVLGGRTAADYKTRLRDIKGTPPNFDSEVVIARTLEGVEGGLFIGAGAGQLAPDSELANIKENAVGLFVNIPRVEAVASQNADRDRRIDVLRPRFLFETAAATPLIARSRSTPEVPTALIGAITAPSGLNAAGDQELALEAWLGAALAQTDAQALSNGPLDFTVDVDKDNLRIMSRTVGSVTPIANTIAGSAELMARLSLATARRREVQVTVEVGANGTFRWDTLEVRIRRRPQEQMS